MTFIRALDVEPESEVIPVRSDHATRRFLVLQRGVKRALRVFHSIDENAGFDGPFTPVELRTPILLIEEGLAGIVVEWEEGEDGAYETGVLVSRASFELLDRARSSLEGTSEQDRTNRPNVIGPDPRRVFPDRPELWAPLSAEHLAEWNSKAEVVVAHGPFGARLVPASELKSTAEAGRESGAGEKSRSPRKRSKLSAEALDAAAAAMLTEHPDWNRARIARELGERKQRLYERDKLPKLALVEERILAEREERRARLADLPHRGSLRDEE